LEPKSAFAERASHFLAAKTKRQVIMVAHSANLVIDTDADQTIVADGGISVSGGLPRMPCMGRGVENAKIR